MLCCSFQTTDLSEASLALFSIAPARESGKRGCDITQWPHGLGPVSVGENFVSVVGRDATGYGMTYGQNCTFRALTFTP